MVDIPLRLDLLVYSKNSGNFVDAALSSDVELRYLTIQGGWPMTLNLREYVCYSKEVCVRKNSIRGRKRQILTSGSKEIHVMDALSLQRLIFPTASLHVIGDRNEEEIDLAQKKLPFAADWVIKQASESDYRLYIRWLELFGSPL